MTKLTMTFAFALLLGATAPAFAQTEPPPPSETPPPAPVVHRSSAGDGAGIGVGAALLSASTGDAPLGVGQFVYDQSMFHIEGLFGFNSFNNGPDGRRTEWIFGAGGWYHLHRGASSDFSLGGALAIDTINGGGDPDLTVTILEPGAQARVFLTSNVALHGRVGFSFILGDAGGANIFRLGGQMTGGFGFTYFFR
jgi:hypothetical protein